MKCEKCRQFAEEYIDGELKTGLAAEVSAHVTNCAGCAKFYEELKQEQAVYSRYQRDIEITPALWAGVEARIKQQKTSQPSEPVAGLLARLAGLFATPRFSPALAAALVVVAVGVTVLVMNLTNSSNNNQPVAVDRGNSGGASTGNANKAVEPPAPNPVDKSNNLAIDTAASQQAPTENDNKPATQKQFAAAARPPQPKRVDPMQLVREAEQKYIRAIAILSRDVNNRRTQIDPMVLARFDSALAGIDRAINDTRRVVREHPDDPVALQYLLSAYAKKVDALREMALD